MTSAEFIAKVFESGVVPMPCVSAYGKQISPHLTMGIDMLWSPDNQQFTTLPQMVDLFEETRVNQWKAPILVDAWFRTEAHEEALDAKGYHTATFASAHEFGAGGDFRALRPGAEAVPINANGALRMAFENAAKALGFPAPRIGYKIYGGSLIHVDLWFMLFEPYSSLRHPKDWPDLQQDVRDAYAKAIAPGVEW